jgi:hypothetical protein
MTHDKSGVNRRRFLAGAAASVGGAAALGGLTAGAAAADPAGGSAAAGVPGGGGTAPAPASGAAAAITRSDQQYPDLIRALNARYVAAPDLVQVVDNPAQIPPIVSAAVRAGKRLTVRSGGHCLEDFVYNPDVQVVIDLTNMNRVYYDSAHNAIAVEPGATLLDVYTKLYQTWGVTVPGGFCYSVGMGGHVSGGGWGMLTRRDGLIVDHLYGVEVVVVDANGSVRTVVATREPDDPHRDLWWAHTGGGGGNFGVITRFLFRSPGVTSTDPRKLLPKPPAQVLLNLSGWAWSDLTQGEFVRLMHNYSQWHADNISPTSPTRFLTSFMAVGHISNGSVGMLTQVDAAAPNAQQILYDYLAYISAGVSTPAGHPQDGRHRAHGGRGEHGAAAVARGHPQDQHHQRADQRPVAARRVQVRVHEDRLPAGPGGGAVQAPDPHRHQQPRYQHPDDRVRRRGQRRGPGGDRLPAPRRRVQDDVDGGVAESGRRRGEHRLGAGELCRGVGVDRRGAGAERRHRRLLRELSRRGPERSGLEQVVGSVVDPLLQGRLSAAAADQEEVRPAELLPPPPVGGTPVLTGGSARR